MITSSEQKFEDDFVGWLNNEGWNTYQTGNKYGGTKLDEKTGRSNSEIIHYKVLKRKIMEINPYVDEQNADNVIKEVKDRLYTQTELTRSNMQFYKILKSGIDVELSTDTGRRKKRVQLIDYNDIDSNRFDAVSQFVHDSDEGEVRPDIALFINGIPIVIGELKDSSRGKTTGRAISDLKSYEETHEKLFYPVLFNIAATRQKMKYGAVGLSDTYYNPWKPEDINPDARHGEIGYDVEDSVKSLCKQNRILEILEKFVFYDVSGAREIKVIPRHQQYFATTKIFDRVKEAKTSGLNSARGLVWHTQGSGKSFTMYYAARIASSTKNAKSVIIVDRKDLREQMSKELRRIEPDFDVDVANTGTQLEKYILGSSDIVLTTIQLFDGIEDSLKTKETYIFADEAHRNMEKDYGTHLNIAFPSDSGFSVHHFGFTGTPVLEGDLDDDSDDKSESVRNTFNHYSMIDLENETPYLHRYSMRTGIDEGTIVPVNMVEREGALTWNMDKQKVDREFLQQYSGRRKELAKQKVNKELSVRDIAEIPSRAELIADDINEYYDKHVRSRAYSNKAMVVTASRKSAYLIGSRLKELLGDEVVEVLYTRDKDDSAELEKFYTTGEERKDIRENYKNDDNPKILVVCSMLLTGFDAPILGTIFMDRNLKEHRLMQAIARANRPNDGKQFGEIIDYWGVTEDIENMYDDIEEDITIYVSRNKEQFIDEYDQQLETLMHQCPYDSPYDNADYIFHERDHDKFLEDFKRLRNLRSAIQPDKRIKEQARDEKYDSLEDVYNNIKSIERENGPDDPFDKKEFREKAKKAIEAGVEIERSSVDDVDYSDSVTVDEWLPENIKVREKQMELSSIVKKRSAQSPAFKDLSKQVEEIIEDWYQGHSTEDTMDRLDEVADKLNTRTTPDEVGEREWLETVVMDVLVEEIDAEIDVDERMVESIVDDFIDVWEETRNISNNRKREVKIYNQIRRKLILRSEGYRDLASTDFPKRVTEYLSRNI